MRFARSILSLLFFLFYGAAAALFTPFAVLPLLSEKSIRRILRIFYRVFVFLARTAGLFTVQTQGRLRPKDHSRGRIVVMNHISLIDIVILMARLGDATAIAKDGVISNPFLSPVVKRIFIVNNSDFDTISSRVSALIDEGVDVVIFPQGTRGGTSLHRGAARLALSTRANILPARISYAPCVLAKHQPWWDAGARTIRIALTFGEEITPRGKSCRADAKLLTSDIARAIGI